jgi:DNA polymerase delta subunit 1
VAKFGRQPCLPLASAVTTIGRQLIDKTKKFCEEYVPGSKVIYGDTDSVMWNVYPDRDVKGDCIKDAFDMANKAVKAIAPIYEHDGKNHIVLEFENVYVNYLLLAKKTYSALQYSAVGLGFLLCRVRIPVSKCLHLHAIKCCLCF